ncbi:MAG: RNA-binding protein [Thermoproteota archaeon]|nr:MAG: RNA-binding protein [Candidatus Korarchaeota archaeon]
MGGEACEMTQEVKVFVKDRQLVLPGQVLAEGALKAGPHVYKDGSKLRSMKIGLASIRENTVSIIPLRGGYFPRVGDIIVGKVIDADSRHLLLDIKSPMPGILPIKGGTRIKIGDTVKARIKSFDGISHPILTIRGPKLGKVRNAVIFDVEPMKIPRIIGRKGSMINMMKEIVGCEIEVGQNGKVIVYSKDPAKLRLIEEALRKIEREAHISGLSDKIRNMLEKGVRNANIRRKEA